VYDSEVGKVTVVRDAYSRNGGCMYDGLLRKTIGEPGKEE
jgi:hypothetical protein